MASLADAELSLVHGGKLCARECLSHCANEVRQVELDRGPIKVPLYFGPDPWATTIRFANQCAQRFRPVACSLDRQVPCTAVSPSISLILRSCSADVAIPACQRSKKKIDRSLLLTRGDVRPVRHLQAGDQDVLAVLRAED